MLLLLFAVCFLSISEAALIGAKKPLKGEEFKTEHVVTAVKYATNEIHKQKLRNGEINDCTRLNSKLLRGSTQAVAGMKYYLELKVTPSALMNDDCANKVNNGVMELKPEVCEAEVFAQPWKNVLDMIRFVCLQLED